MNHILFDYITFIFQFRRIVPTDVFWCIESPQVNTVYTSHVLRTKVSDTTTRIRSVFQWNRQYVISLYTSLTSQMCRIYLCRYGTTHKNIARNNHYASYSTYLYCQRWYSPVTNQPYIKKAQHEIWINRSCVLVRIRIGISICVRTVHTEMISAWKYVLQTEHVLWLLCINIAVSFLNNL
jgi:hypothetical protein